MKIYQHNSQQRREEQKLMNWALAASTLVATIAECFIHAFQLKFFDSLCGTMLPSAGVYLVFMVVARIMSPLEKCGRRKAGIATGTRRARPSDVWQTVARNRTLEIAARNLNLGGTGNSIMNKFWILPWTLPLALVLTGVGATQTADADESVRLYIPATPELDIINQRLSDLESRQGQSRDDFIFSVPETRRLAVKVAVYRAGKLDTAASGLFHIYGVPNPNDSSKRAKAGSFSISRTYPQISDKPANGRVDIRWTVSLPGYSYEFAEKSAATESDYQGSATFAETADLRRGAVIRKASTGQFRLSVWVQSVPRQKNDPRYGIKRFAVAAPKKSSR